MSNQISEIRTGIPPLMAHLVAGYPDLESSYSVAVALVEGGASLLEIQFPFSDPSADGPSIQEACTVSLSKGFRTDDGFELVRRIRGSYSVPIFIMSYANVVFSRGVARFVLDAAGSGAAGLIIPDLPVDSDEGLYAAARNAGIAAVPVVTPDIAAHRLKLITASRPDYVYVAMRSGITGAYTAIDRQQLDFLSKIGSSGAKVMAGFGIRSHDQLRVLSGYVDFAVAGSVFVDAVRTSDPGFACGKVRLKTAEICGGPQENISTLRR